MEGDRFDWLMAGIAQQFEAMQLYIDQRINDVLIAQDRRFDAVDRRFEQVDRRFEQVDRRFDEDRRIAAGQFEAMQKRSDERFASMMTALVGRLDNHETRIRRIEKKERPA